jgi:hypothetical protein
MPMTEVIALEGDTVRGRNTMTAADCDITGVESVVLACGSTAVDELGDQLRGLAPDLHVIGDALSPRRIVHAVLEGARVGHLL